MVLIINGAAEFSREAILMWFGQAHVWRGGDALGLLVGRGRSLDRNFAERRPKITERGYEGHGFGRARIEAERDEESSRIL